MGPTLLKEIKVSICKTHGNIGVLPWIQITHFIGLCYRDKKKVVWLDS